MIKNSEIKTNDEEIEFIQPLKHKISFCKIIKNEKNNLNELSFFKNIIMVILCHGKIIFKILGGYFAGKLFCKSSRNF
jgi:hypothetical protein